MSLSKVKHILLPGHEIAEYDVLPEETIASFLERTELNTSRLPTICVVNGQPILREAWTTTTMSTSDSASFLSKPYGGGGSGGNKGKQVLGLLAVVALAAIAPWAAGGLFAAGSFGFYATVAAITIGGGLLLSSFLAPKTSATTSETVPQLYSLTASGNTAAPMQPIPVQYGRLKVEPPYVSIPWSEYIGDDLYLNIALCQGVGYYDVENILIDDTVLWDRDTGLSGTFTDVSYQFVQPGDPLTLFPSNVISASEVNGQEITTTPLGGFVANNAGTLATAIAFDFVFPAGLFSTNDQDSELHNATVRIIGQIRIVDNAGTPVGSWITLLDETFTLNTRAPKRFSRKYNVAEARYEARMSRTTTPSSDSKTSDGVQWGGLRAFLKGTDVFEGVSVLAVRIKATAQLSQSSAKKVGLVQTRKVNVWVTDHFEMLPSQNALWALWDAATNTTYGAAYPMSKMDFPTIVDYAEQADFREDSFNYRFDSAVTFQAAFDLILSSVRSKISWIGDILSVMRDDWKPIPQMLLTDQQTVRGSLSIDYIINDEQSSDSVVAQFLNENTWAPAQIQYPPNSNTFTAIAPTNIQLEGITNPDHLFREIRFLYKQSQRRRLRIRLDTEHDGRLLRFGSAVKIQSNLPRKWGQSGEVLSYNSASHILTLDRALVWTPASTHYIELRDRGAHYFGPVIVAPVDGQPKQARFNVGDLTTVEGNLGQTVEQALDRMDGAEPPAFAFGIAGSLSRNCIVLSGKPNGDKVSLELTVDYLDVHTDDDLILPTQPTPTFLADPRIPIVYGLEGTFRQGIAEPYLDVSWWPATGAAFYRVQVSYDSGASWIAFPDTTTPNFSSVVSRASLRVRVSAQGILAGPWASKDFSVPNITIGPTTVSPESFKKNLRDYVMKELNEGFTDFKKILDYVAAIASEHDASRMVEEIKDRSARTILHKFAIENTKTKVEELRSDVQTLDIATNSRITIVQQTAADDKAAQASINTTVTSSLNSLTGQIVATNATVTQNFNTLVTLQGSVASLDTSVTTRFATTNTNIEGLRSRVSLAEAAIVVNQQAISDANGSIATLATSVSTRFATTDTNVAGLVTRVTIAESSITSLAISITDVNTSVASLASSVTARFSVTNDRVTTAEANIVNNASAIASANSSISALSSSVTARFSFTNGKVADVESSVASLSYAFSDPNGSFAIYKNSVTSRFQSNEASITFQAATIATVDGKVNAVYGLNLDVNGYISGWTSINNGYYAAMVIYADKFYIAQPGVGGGEAVPVFAIQSLNGFARITFRGDMYADGTITAVKLSVAYLSAISSNIGTITAGLIQSPDGRMIINLSAGYILIYD